MSKGFIVFILVITLFCVGWYIGNNSKDNSTEINQRISAIQGELDKYKNQEQQEKVRELELQALQNPQVVIDQFKKVGKLITYEGKASYEDVIKEDTFWGSRQLTLDLKYNFGISMDLSKVEVINVSNRLVTLQIPKDKLLLEYLELNPELSKVKSKKTWFLSDFMPTEVKYILSNAYIITKNRIISTKGIFDMAYTNLQDNLTSLMHELGYDKVEFE
jgi:hypothetical protein